MDSSTNQGFPATIWNVIDAAKDRRSPAFYEALNVFAASYWRPVFHFLRARGYPTHRAEDLTQEFFLQFMDRDWITKADPNRGRFRTFLLTILTRFLSDRSPQRAPKQRTFDDRLVSISALIGDDERSLDPPDTGNPERAFMKQWAKATLERVRNSFRVWCIDRGRPDWYAVFHEFHFPPDDARKVGQQELAERFHISRDQVRYAIDQANAKFAELMRSEVAQQVNSAVDDELVDLEIQELEDLLSE